MLRACIIDFGGGEVWDNFLQLCELSHNNNYHSSIGIALFEALFMGRSISLVGRFEVGDLKPFGTDLVNKDQEKVGFFKIICLHHKADRRNTPIIRS